MTNQEILTKAIEKAIAGGFVADNSWEATVPYLVNKGGFRAVIYQHDFAKSLWGNGYEVDDDGTPEQPQLGWFIDHRWQYHLQQMVIADDPIKYLGENT